MLKITNTKNLAGVCISGDYYDLGKLIQALHTITINEFTEQYQQYHDLATRVLALCYHLRQAMQGKREVELKNNGMTEELMKHLALITPKHNVYYQCYYLYPEMFFLMLALNKLIELRIRHLSKQKQVGNNAFDSRVIWDETIAIIRLFQARFQKAIFELMTENNFSRWLKIMNDDFIYIEQIALQYVDVLNIDYLQMSREKRLKSLLRIARRIAHFQYDEEHREIKDVVVKAAREYKCREAEIRLVGSEYPPEIIW